MSDVTPHHLQARKFDFCSQTVALNVTCEVVWALNPNLTCLLLGLKNQSLLSCRYKPEHMNGLLASL